MFVDTVKGRGKERLKVLDWRVMFALRFPDGFSIFFQLHCRNSADPVGEVSKYRLHTLVVGPGLGRDEAIQETVKVKECILTAVRVFSHGNDCVLSGLLAGYCGECKAGLVGNGLWCSELRAMDTGFFGIHKLASQVRCNRRFRKRWRRPQILKFCGDDRLIRLMHVLIWPRL